MSAESVEQVSPEVFESPETKQFQVDRIPLKSVIGDKPKETSPTQKTAPQGNGIKQDSKKNSRIPSSRTTQVSDITLAIQKEIERLLKLSNYYQSRSPKSFSAYKMERLINKIRLLQNTLQEIDEASAPSLINLYRQYVLREK